MIWVGASLLMTVLTGGRPRIWFTGGLGKVLGKVLVVISFRRGLRRAVRNAWTAARRIEIGLKTGWRGGVFAPLWNNRVRKKERLSWRRVLAVDRDLVTTLRYTPLRYCD